MSHGFGNVCVFLNVDYYYYLYCGFYDKTPAIIWALILYTQWPQALPQQLRNRLIWLDLVHVSGFIIHDSREVFVKNEYRLRSVIYMVSYNTFGYIAQACMLDNKGNGVIFFTKSYTCKCKKTVNHTGATPKLKLSQWPQMIWLQPKSLFHVIKNIFFQNRSKNPNQTKIDFDCDTTKWTTKGEDTT